MARAITQIGINRSNFEQVAPPVSSHLTVTAAEAADNAMKKIAMLKKLVMGAALAALLGTTALAQSYDPDEGGGNINPPIASLQGQQAPHPDNAFAYVPQRVHSARAMHNWQRQQSLQTQQDR